MCGIKMETNRGTPQKIISEITHRKSGGHYTRILQRRLVSCVAGFPDLTDQDDDVFDGNGRDQEIPDLDEEDLYFQEPSEDAKQREDELNILELTKTTQLDNLSESCNLEPH